MVWQFATFTVKIMFRDKRSINQYYTPLEASRCPVQVHYNWICEFGPEEVEPARATSDQYG